MQSTLKSGVSYVVYHFLMLVFESNVGFLRFQKPNVFATPACLSYVYECRSKVTEEDIKEFVTVMTQTPTRFYEVSGEEPKGSVTHVSNYFLLKFAPQRLDPLGVSAGIRVHEEL